MIDDKKSAPVRISKAPPPITPLVLSPPKLPKFDTNVKGVPNWKHWRHVSTIEIWQGLLLSLNIEPPGKGWLLDNKPGATGDIPYEYLDNHGLTNEFIRRWCLVKNRLDTYYGAAGLLLNAELTNFLKLPLFAAWAVEFEWEEIPPELAALAKAAPQAAPLVKATPTTKVEAGAGTTPAPADEIPGIIPKTTSGKLAIKAAWEIECETGKRATAKQVIERLQTWVDHKDNPKAVSELIKKIPNGVQWVTSAGKEKNYNKVTCQKTLETWNKSRD